MKGPEEKDSTRLFEILQSARTAQGGQLRDRRYQTTDGCAGSPSLILVYSHTWMTQELFQGITTWVSSSTMARPQVDGRGGPREAHNYQLGVLNDLIDSLSQSDFRPAP